METAPTPVAAAAAGKVFNGGPSRRVQCRVGRGMSKITEAYNKQCSCEREKTLVFCRVCGYCCHGRIRIKCEQHPRVTFLLDIAQCPRCLSTTYLQEYYKK